jgi:hypothetical protein
MHRTSPILTLFCLWGLTAVPVAIAQAPASPPPVDTTTIRAVSRYLASDALSGRGTGTPGSDSAAAYLARTCERLGFRPVGGSSYLQNMPLVSALVDSVGTTVHVKGPDVDTTFVYWEEFIPDVATARTLRGFAGPLAYVGRAPDILFRRSELPPLEGTVALLRGEFGASGAAADTLFARGAVGVIEVIDDARRYRLFRQTRGRSRLFVDDSTVQSSFIGPMPAILAGPRMTVTLSQGLTGVTHGSWNDAYLNGLAAGLPSPRLLEGWSVEVSVRHTTHPRRAANVACMLQGRGAAADTALALTAHYDHLGIGTPDSSGDSVYNGFSDNAVGVAMALGIGEAYVKARRAGGGLQHTLLLLFFTGEEHGLLGADYYATHPSWPLARIRGLVNLDANAPGGPPTSWRLAGDDALPITALVQREIQRHGWTGSIAPPAPGSDYFAFLRRGVPSVFVVPSDGPYEGLSVTQSDSVRTSVWGRYHQPNDEFREDFPFAGIGRYADFTRDVLAAADRRPRPARRLDVTRRPGAP